MPRHRQQLSLVIQLDLTAQPDRETESALEALKTDAVNVWSDQVRSAIASIRRTPPVIISAKDSKDGERQAILEQMAMLQKKLDQLGTVQGDCYER